MKKLISLILLFVFSQMLYAQQEEVLQGRLIYNGEKIFLGDNFTATLQIWPFDKLGEPNFLIIKEKTIGKDLLGLFHVVDVKKINLSPNNVDVVEMSLSLVLIQSFSQKELHHLEILNKSMGISLIGFDEIEVSTKEPKDFIFSERKIEKLSVKKWSDYLPIIIIFIVLLLVSPVLRKLYIKRQKTKAEKLKEQEKIDFWVEKFSKANSRGDFEEIYLRRDEWILLAGGINTNIKSFFDDLDKYQYKLRWDDESLKHVKTSFSEIKYIFNQLKG